jgi:Flp pilus assembly pilin Flp
MTTNQQRPGTPRRGWKIGAQHGQSTVEYALILLGAAAIALMVIAWATRSDAIGQLFDAVLGRVLQDAR